MFLHFLCQISVGEIPGQSTLYAEDEEGDLEQELEEQEELEDDSADLHPQLLPTLPPPPVALPKQSCKNATISREGGGKRANVCSI